MVHVTKYTYKKITSPIPEEAPVMSMTLPATFSLYMDLFKDQRNLRKRNGGMKSSNTVRVIGRSTRFKNLWSKSIALLQWTERKREILKTPRNWVPNKRKRFQLDNVHYHLDKILVFLAFTTLKMITNLSI